MTMCIDHSASRYLSKFEDPLGRWSTLSLSGKNGRTVHFVTVYQVVDKDTTGPYTAYQQEKIALRLNHRMITPQKAFITDIDKYLGVLTKDTKSQMVLMGDLNEVVGKDLTGFPKITSKYLLVDIHGHFHNNQTEVPTYPQGNDRLDFVFWTLPLLSAVLQCGAEPFNQHIFSDHRALFVDWDESKLFGSSVSTMVSSKQRRLQSKSLPSRNNYIHELHQYCIDHTIFQRIDKLMLSPSPATAEAIDRDITRGMPSAELRCRTVGPDPWSIKLKKARLLVEIFKHSLSMLRFGLDTRHKIDRLLAKYVEPIDLPDKITEVKSGLKDAQSNLRQVRQDAAAHRKEMLTNRISAAQIQQDPTKKNAVERIAKAEALKELHSKLKFISQGWSSARWTHSP